ncbi:NmrA family NAD(P)-binding protein [Actinomadura fibrosa]|uniref:NmrA family NAD(P)-binding protein n=1 Tax=Actinomadura fibrosa TaxID=111802 RepID=A0ABW2XKT4_9ACTN|nr:NmrA family NAD(P)-binding protein [Actinomadura fibrosa]
MTDEDGRERGARTILVTGATGRQGGAVVRHLLHDGWQVRALTRDPTSTAARDLAAAGARVHGGDLDDPTSLLTAADGVHGVFSVQTGALGAPPVPFEAEVRRGIAVAQAAVSAAHLVYASVAGADGAAGVPAFEAKLRIEEHIHRAGLPATVLRPVSFMENYLGTGAIATPFVPDVPEQLIAVDDIGAFAALAFAAPRTYLGQTLTIAGDAVTPPDIAATFTEVTGRDTPYIPIPLNELPHDTATAVDYLNRRGGYGADLHLARTHHPRIKDLTTWLTTVNRPNACRTARS